ncbi:hypothetical protein COV11_00455 [Candidatus Woesearchaeota archaeon CG10_big_fil_rev_8_21_14_0_10_30_7]|nr:MAG: hypothetical protein COV11_00455 [Candidatus Woesearchaeota archaeon CG10_big_fil_rev_8_21_14_0_10_30_7]
MAKIKQLLLNWKVLVFITFILLSLIAIRPNFAQGVAIKAVIANSAAANAGFITEKNVLPVNLERIIKIDDQEITNLQDYYSFVETLQVNQTLRFKTNKKLYLLTTQSNDETGEVNNLGLRLINAPTSNIRKGLDLQGGTRVILKPVDAMSNEDLNYIIDNLKQRLNVYGLSDIVVTKISSFTADEQLILVEIAGASEEEVSDLIESQGKFEATIRNQTAFTGGKDSINYVCIGLTQCSGLDPNRPCQQSDGGWSCGFYFQITLSVKAAEQQASLTKNLSIIKQPGGNYLDEPIVFRLDGTEIDSLNIAASLRGKPETDIVISGNGQGSNYNEARDNALENMKKLQTVLQTGSLPTKLEIIKSDTISPVLGDEFINNAFLMAFVAILSVAIVITLIYRKIKIIIPLLITGFAEVLLILGMASFIGWNLDLAAIAGILAAVGTGVDDFIIVTDEVLRKEEQSYEQNWKRKLKRAFFIIMAAYFTTVVAMIPLWYFGAGLLKGFAITTIIGITLGVFVTRPAYAEFLKFTFEEE